MQRDRAAAVCCTYIQKVDCAVICMDCTKVALFYSPVNFKRVNQMYRD